MKSELSNDSLLPAPYLLPLLYSILIHFYINKYALVANIKQAFLQICLYEEHHVFVHFLWHKDVQTNLSKIIITQFQSVVFRATSSPFLLNATTKNHLDKYLPRADYQNVIEKLILNLYVDNSTNTFNLVEEETQFYKKSKSVLTDANLICRNGQQII